MRSIFPRQLLSPLPLCLIAALSGCTEKHYYQLPPSDDDDDTTAHRDSGVPTEGADAGEQGGDAGAVPLEEGAPVVDTPVSEHELDVFERVGNRYWFVVNEEQVRLMNVRYDGGGPIFLFNQYGDIYTPGGEDGVTFADHLLVTTAGEGGRSADYGKVQVRLIGESTGRPWTTSTLPNIKVDADEFTAKNRIGEVKHVRFNNALVGSIYREKLTLDLYRKLGYPAPRANHAWVSSSVWGKDVAVPYVVVESYKPHFCTLRQEELEGGCENMWEFPGDFGFGSFENPDSCQFRECDNERVLDFEADALATPQGEGFQAALSEWLDWDAFHEFQCLSWILATGDDALHNSNNLVLVERADGKFQLLPYSVDISLGQDWYPEVSLSGGSLLARGCQSDSECWADTIRTCEALLEDFTALDPVAMLDDLHDALDAEGMLRTGDEDRYRGLRKYLERRLEELPIELEQNRDAPAQEFCEYPMIQCGDFCAYPEECVLCEQPVEPEPAMQDRAEIALPVPMDPIIPDGDGGAAPVDPGPFPCIPFVEMY